MALEIVWRHPFLPPKTESRVRRVTLDDFGAVYAVRSQDATEEFELILRGDAWSEKGPGRNCLVPFVRSGGV